MIRIISRGECIIVAQLPTDQFFFQHVRGNTATFFFLDLNIIFDSVDPDKITESDQGLNCLQLIQHY